MKNIQERMFLVLICLSTSINFTFSQSTQNSKAFIEKQIEKLTTRSNFNIKNYNKELYIWKTIDGGNIYIDRSTKLSILVCDTEYNLVRNIIIDISKIPDSLCSFLEFSYTLFSNFWVTEKGFYFATYKHILNFNLDGSFISSIKLPTICNLFEKIKIYKPKEFMLSMEYPHSIIEEDTDRLESIFIVHNSDSILQSFNYPYYPSELSLFGYSTFDYNANYLINIKNMFTYEIELYNVSKLEKINTFKSKYNFFSLKKNEKISLKGPNQSRQFFAKCNSIRHVQFFGDNDFVVMRTKENDSVNIYADIYTIKGKKIIAVKNNISFRNYPYLQDDTIDTSQILFHLASNLHNMIWTRNSMCFVKQIPDIFFNLAGKKYKDYYEKESTASLRSYMVRYKF